MPAKTVEESVKAQILDIEQKQQTPVAVLLGHEDWMYFVEQSKVAYTPFGSARHHQPALGGLLLIRVNEESLMQVLTQTELDQVSHRYSLA